MNNTTKTWQKVIGFSELDDEEPSQIKIGNKVIAICKLGDQAYAIDDICTHEHAFLSDGIIDDDCVECPLHMALFDIRTGEARALPATEGLQIYPTRIEDGTVWVEI